jgi:error-prone DNA polymerase
MERLRGRLFEGMAERGITGDIAQQIFDKLAAFANFGFPESHSVSFAYLVYSSSYLKRYFPAAFCAGLLNAQPMGFYSPHTLVADARRHGVVVRTPDLAASGVGATLEWVEGSVATSANVPFPLDAFPVGGVEVAQPAVRLGLSSVRSVGDELAESIVAERETNGPYASMADLAQRIDIDRTALEAMATAGVFSNCTDRSGTHLDRRRALWVAGAVAETSADRLPGIVTGTDAPSLPGLSDRELAGADLWATGVSPDGHPTLFEREHLASLGVLTAIELRTAPTDTRVLVGGVVTHRQRPSTAHGITFVNLEDETGLINVVCSPGLWKRYRRVARGAPALLVRGRLERVDDVINVVADKLEPLPVVGGHRSRDFR